MPACTVFHCHCCGVFPFMPSPLQGHSLSSPVGRTLVSGILTPSSGPSALARQPPPCARLGSGWKGAVSLDTSKLYSWGTLTTPHLARNGLSHNKVRTTVSHRFHRTSESCQEAATLAGELNKVDPLVVKLTLSFLPPPSTKKSLKSLSKKRFPCAVKKHYKIALKYSLGRSAHLLSFQDQPSNGRCKERAPLCVHHHSSWRRLPPASCPCCG